MEKRIENAIDIFLDALNNGTLAKGTCFACAVGNLVAAGMDAVVIHQIDGNKHKYDCTKNNKDWSQLFYTPPSGKQATTDYEKVFKHLPRLKKEIENTNFTVYELAQIEFAFETNAKINHQHYHGYTKEEIRADQIKALEAVVKVMLTFNEDTKTDVKEVFTNKAELIKL